MMRSKGSLRRFGVFSLAGILLLSSNPVIPDHVSAEPDASSKLIINEVYGGGGKESKDGSVKAPYKNDFIELYNPTNEDIDLDEFTLTYTNSKGDTVQTFQFTDGQVIKANDYFLLRGEATLGDEGDKGFRDAFVADAYYDTPNAGIGMSDEKGNVELNKNETVIDALSYGEPDTIKGEGSPITGITFDTSVRRINFIDTNNNSADFEVVTPSPTMSGYTEGDVELIELKKITDIKTQANLIGQRVTVEGQVSAANVKASADGTLYTYIQDDSGALNAIGLDAKKGQRVQLTGMVQEVNGETSLLIEQVTVLDESEADVPVASVSSNEALALEGYQVSVTGDVTAKTENTLTLNNELSVYFDSTVGSTANIEEGQSVTVTGVMAPNQQGQLNLVLSSMDDLAVNEEEKEEE
jgi:predicted extracellular nuclease